MQTNQFQQIIPMNTKEMEEGHYDLQFIRKKKILCTSYVVAVT